MIIAAVDPEPAMFVVFTGVKKLLIYCLPKIAAKSIPMAPKTDPTTPTHPHTIPPSLSSRQNKKFSTVGIFIFQFFHYLIA